MVNQQRGERGEGKGPWLRRSREKTGQVLNLTLPEGGGGGEDRAVPLLQGGGGGKGGRVPFF